MNEQFLRMKKLLEGAGISFNEGGISSAELYAYAKGAELIADYINDIETVVFLMSEDVDKMAGYANMLKIDRGRFDAEGLEAEIIRRLSLPFGESCYGDVETAFSDNVCSGSYELDSDVCTVRKTYLEDLKEAGKFLSSYAPPCAVKVYAGDGERLTFDMWDSIAYTFNEFDSLQLPCEFLESLRSDIFEQH